MKTVSYRRERVPLKLLVGAVVAVGCSGERALGEFEVADLSGDDICGGCVLVLEREVLERGGEYAGVVVTIDGPTADEPLFLPISINDLDLMAPAGNFVVEVPQGLPRVAFGHFPYDARLRYASSGGVYSDRQLTKPVAAGAAFVRIDVRVPSEVVSPGEVGGVYYFEYLRVSTGL